ADAGKTLFATVTAANAYGWQSVETLTTGVVGAPTVLGEPAISGDPNVDGTTLSVSTGTWTGSPTSYTYQWFSCPASTLACAPIPGATASTYQVDDAVLNDDYLTVKVGASDASGSATNAAEPSFAIGVARTNVIGAVVSSPQLLVYPSWTGDPSKAGN